MIILLPLYTIINPLPSISCIARMNIKEASAAGTLI
jgi:hypothetical protein